MEVKWKASVLPNGCGYYAHPGGGAVYTSTHAALAALAGGCHVGLQTQC